MQDGWLFPPDVLPSPDTGSGEETQDPRGRRLELQGEFGRQVLVALRLEWELAARGLPDDVRARVRMPGFGLTDGAKPLGVWVGKPIREIRLSLDFIQGHPWFAVVDVLRHEMAHQLASEVLGGAHEKPHGPAFRQACGLLNANPAASGRYPTLDDVEATGSGKLSEQDRHLSRIRKLLALAESTNRHEAERAMAKAHELMARHNVELLSRDAARNYVTVHLGEPQTRQSRDAYVLSSILRDFYYVDTIWVPSAVLAKGKLGRVLEISGLAHNVAIARYVHDYMTRFVAAEWKRRHRGTGGRVPMTGRRDFALGVLSGFRETLTVRAEGCEASRALVRLGDSDLDRYVRQRHPNRRSIRGKRLYVNADLLAAGEELGREIVIRRGIEERQGNRRKLLE